METHKIKLLNTLTLKDGGTLDTGIPEVLVESILGLKENLAKEKLFLAPIIYDPHTLDIIFSVIQGSRVGYRIIIEKNK
jgi:hypothetical protein